MQMKTHKECENMRKCKWNNYLCMWIFARHFHWHTAHHFRVALLKCTRRTRTFLKFIVNRTHGTMNETRQMKCACDFDCWEIVVEIVSQNHLPTRKIAKPWLITRNHSSVQFCSYLHVDRNPSHARPLETKIPRKDSATAVRCINLTEHSTVNVYSARAHIQLHRRHWIERRQGMGITFHECSRHIKWKREIKKKQTKRGKKMFFIAKKDKQPTTQPLCLSASLLSDTAPLS